VHLLPLALLQLTSSFNKHKMECLALVHLLPLASLQHNVKF